MGAALSGKCGVINRATCGLSFAHLPFPARLAWLDVNILSRSPSDLSSTHDNMKSNWSWIAYIGLFLASGALGFAGNEDVAMHESREWVIISGTGFEDKGPLPWTYAIKKSTILSACIQTDPRILYPQEGPRQFHDTTPEEVEKLPAIIRITTTELTSSTSPQNKTHTISGLTHATAPLMLEKILAAIDSRDAVNGGK